MLDKVALITGATSGIGHATALLFAQHGFKIVAAGRNEKAGKELVKEMGGDGLFVVVDVADGRSVKSLFEQIEKHYGRLDAAVNNAGIEGVLGPVAEMQEKDWDALMNTNLRGVWLCMKQEIAAMKGRGGSIVNISTNLIRMSEPATGAYTASKAAVEALSRIAAVENGPFGIRINTIQPGAVDTPLLKRVYSEEMLDRLKKQNPLGKVATPQDIAEGIYWLCSDKSLHVNGTSFAIDGGG